MSVLRAREKFVCIILLIILSCHGVQSTFEPELEPEPESDSNPPIPGTIRFVDGAKQSGRLQIYYDEEWGTICNDGWTRSEATVVCKSLGFSQGEPLMNITEGSGQIFLADVRCDGTEDTILQCQNNKFGVHNCNHSTDAGVKCDGVATTSLDNSPDSCDFDTGTCGYIFTTGIYRWMRRSGRTPSSNTGPTRDHGGNGYYAYTEASSGSRGYVATMRSPYMYKYIGSIQFWYHMYGATIGTLNVKAQVPGRTYTYWSMSGNRGNMWYYACVNVDSTVNYVTFEGIRGGSYTGDIAVDDILYSQDRCADIDTASCTFEKSMCGYQVIQGNGSVTSWGIISGSDNRAPIYDHTTNKPYGRYAALWANYYREGMKSYMVSQSMAISEKQKIEFYYFMNGNMPGELQVSFRDLSVPLDDWTEHDWQDSGNHGVRWNYGCMDLHPELDENNNRTLKRIQFTGITGQDKKISLLLDDIKISNGSCEQGIEYKTCEFQNPKMCNYKINCTAYDEYTWRRASGATKSLRTGPSSDSSKKVDGFYLYAESSYGNTGDAVSVTFPLKNPNGKYLKFNYHMYGVAMGSLKLMYHKGSTVKEVWRVSGNHGNSWKFFCQKVIEDIDSLSLVAVRGSSFTSDIAVDNVFMDTKSCPNPVNCDFENGMCNYTASHQSSMFRWIMTFGPDHTQGSNGHYLQSTSPYNSEGLSANITTTAIAANKNVSSVSFFYQGSKFTGRLMANLKRQSVLTTTNMEDVKEFKTSHEGWIQGCLDIPVGESVSVNLMSYSGMNRGRLMLDDVMYNERPCVEGILDETCTFDEPNVCGFKVSCRDATKFLWTRARKSDSSMTGPVLDHTPWGNGHFMYTDASFGGPGDETSLEFLEFIAPEGHYLEFYYNMNGRDIGVLQVAIGVESEVDVNDNSKGMQLKWYEKGNQGTSWYKGCVNIPANKKVKAVFTGIRGNGPLGNIALDDISVKRGICYERDINCDFSDSMICGYKNMSTNSNGWRRVRTASGYAMLFSNTYGTATLISPYKNITDSCVQIDYKIKGGSLCSLDVFMDHDKLKLSLKNLNTTSMQKAQFHVKQAQTAIRFVAKVGYYYYGSCSIQIEKVSVINGTCPSLACPYNTTSCKDDSKCVADSDVCNRIPDCIDNSDEDFCPKSISCDFEDLYRCGYNFSGWLPMDMGKFSNPDLHLQDSVYSMTLNSGSASIYSPVETIPQSCLQFAYAGGTGSMLEVIANYSNGMSSSKWDNYFSDLTKWTFGQFDLSAGTVQIEFIGNASLLGLAIDNITLHNGTCQKLDPKCPVDFIPCGSNEKCIPPESKCNRFDNCMDKGDEKNCPTSITCDAEDPFQCGYEYDPGTWKVGDGIEDTPSDVDHSLGTYSGAYFVSMFDKYDNDSQHTLWSPNDTLPVDSCLSFFYSFHGNGEFKIHDNGIEKLSLKPHNMYAWTEARISVPKGEHKFAFIHEGSYDWDTVDMLRLDSIKMSNETCKTLECEEGWWKCPKSEYCIPDFKVCDREADCYLSGDEDNCTKYSDVQLFDGRNAKQGFVKIYYNGTWVIPCGYWSQSNADVVCRSLGYTGTSRTTFVTKTSDYIYMTSPITNVKCNGSESSISECSMSKCYSYCSCNIHAAVDCSDSHCPSTKVPCGYVNDTLTPKGNKTKCIYKDSVCDSEKDCPGDTDEKSCPTCKYNELTCLNYECLPWARRCDGVRDCKSGSDEFYCWKHENNTVSTYVESSFYPVCEDNLKDADAANKLCHYLGKGNATVGSSMSSGKGVLFTYVGKSMKHSILPNYKKSIVPSCNILNIKCNEPECGKRSQDKLYETTIQYGQRAPPGKFPWQGVLFRYTTFLCGVVVINRWHVLTAAHCVRGGYSTSSYSINVGSVDLQGGRKYYISKIHAHMNFTMSQLSYDIAVLRVSSPIAFTDYVRPICLPSDRLVSGTQCFVSGWGRMENNQRTTQLQEAKVILLSRTNCQKQYNNYDYTKLCADNKQPHQIGCYGDSGGPLACRNKHGYWEVVGIFSYGRPACTGPIYSSQVFADVYSLRKWILTKLIP